MLLVLLVIFGQAVSSVDAELTTDHRKELATLAKEVRKIPAMIKKKEFDEAQEKMDEVEERVREIAKEAEVELTDRAFTPIGRVMQLQQKVLTRAMEKNNPTKPEPVSFVKDIAPLIDQKCLGCHGNNNPRKGLNLITFGGWKRGGQGGPLIAIGNSQRSLLMARLSADEGQGRMPARGEAFSREELKLVANWIDQGAKFDGAGDDLTLSDLIYEYEKKNLKIKIPKPKGDETVSFTRDIAPFMSNLCVGCHNPRNKSGGLSVANFYDMMKGGDSGEVIIPGNMEDSRLFRLVGGLENPRMPQGQARITRKNYEDLKKWFKEGNAYDGSDPRTPLTTFVKTDAEMAADRFGTMTAVEFKKYRTDRSKDQLKRAVPNDGQTALESEDFLILGNVTESRLKETQTWANEQLAELNKMFGGKPHPWRGRLAIFVLKDRFSYDEFNEVIEQRRADAEMTGHSLTSANQEDAYVVLQDIGDDVTAGKALRISLVEHLSGAYLQQNGSALPDWVVRGTGIMLASKLVPEKQYTHKMQQTAASIVPTLTRPVDVFDSGSFSPSTLGPVGYSLVDYLLKQAGPEKFSLLVQSLQRGQNINDATQRAYGSNSDTIARGFIRSLAK